jgi:hypothetical protein
MPRISPEERAARVFQDRGEYPPPPKRLSPESRTVWDEIVASRPVDHFRPGALDLLEQLCVLIVLARRVGAEVAARPGNADAAELYLSYMHQCAMHAQKLRLTVQTEVVDPRRGILDEREPKRRGRSGELLYGGSNVVKF